MNLNFHISFAKSGYAIFTRDRQNTKQRNSEFKYLIKHIKYKIRAW